MSTRLSLASLIPSVLQCSDASCWSDSVKVFSLSALRRDSLLLQQGVSVRIVPLPPVGPVQLQPLLLSLGVLQHSLPPQALPGLGAEPPDAAGFVCRRQQGRWIRGVFFTPPAAASESFSVLLAGCSELGQLASRLIWTLWGQRGHRRGLRGQRDSPRFLCRGGT